MTKLTDWLSIDARGHYTIGKELADDVMNRIRRMIGIVHPNSPTLILDNH